MASDGLAGRTGRIRGAATGDGAVGDGADAGADRGADAPLVSVLVPVYNAERDLARCLRSIAAMEYREIEVLMLDDGSTDASAAICQTMADVDPRFRYIPCEHGGVSRTRNRGLSESRGTYLMFVDADDIVHPQFLTRMLAAMRPDGQNIVVCDYVQEYAHRGGENRQGASLHGGNDGVTRQAADQRGGDGGIRHYAVAAGEYTRRAYIPQIMIAPASFYVGVLWNKIYRRDIIEEHAMRFHEGTSLGEDFLFNLAYLRHIAYVTCIADRLYYYELQGAGSLTSNRGDIDTYIANRVRLYHGYEAMFEAENMRGIWRFRAQRYMVDQYHEAIRQWCAAGTLLERRIYQGYIKDCNISRASFLTWTLLRRIRISIRTLRTALRGY